MTMLEQQLSIPSGAFLPTNETSAILNTGTTSIPLTPATSINSSRTFLLIGRQASTADIRIDHKSISRKHATLYFMRDSEDAPARAVLRDLGGKYGCHINGGKISGEVILKNGDRIQFGNVRESIFTLEINQDSVERPNKTEIDQDHNPNQGNNTQIKKGIAEEEDGPKVMLTGRAAREAEIAKMMASLDETPTYTKFKSTAGTDNSVANNSLNSENQAQLPTLATQLKLPITSNITLLAQASSSNSHSVPTTVSLDPAGSRLIVGSSDTSLRLYDFAGMDLSAKPFKIVTVQEGHSIVKAVHSNTGDRIIVGTTSAQPMLLDRDGNAIIEFNKGDMYVTDMSHTDGHVSNITGVDWHPLNRDLVITCSLDGSVRIWNLERNKTKFQKLCSGKEVYRIKSSMGKRTKVTCVAFAPGGREFACGTSCGSVQIWRSDKVGSRPERVVFDAHGAGNAIHSLTYNYDGAQIASRCMDDNCVKVWESRRISRTGKPLAICGGLHGHGLYESVNCAFSPNGRILCGGTCVEPKKRDDSYGVLKFYSIDKNSSNSSAGETLKPVLEIDVSKGQSVINTVWHTKLNQIFVSLSDGTVRIFYDAKWSTKGAKLPVAKGLRKTDDLTSLLNSRAPQGSAGILGEIRTPHALPLFREMGETKNTKRKREKERQDPIKSKRPDLPGTGIKVSEGTSSGLNFQQTVLTSAIAKNKNIAGKDPRDELFKYDNGEKKYTKVSYDGDKRILADKTVEEEEEEMKNNKDA